MFRRALTYQLIFAVAVGPLLCCCTAGRLLASTAPRPAAPATTSPASPTPRVTSPCCAHKHAASEPDGPRGDGTPKPAPSKPGEKCPCKDGKSQAKTETVSAEVSTALRGLALDQLTPLLWVVATACPTLAVVEFDGRPGGTPAPLSTADLLYAHHNLRC